MIRLKSGNDVGVKYMRKEFSAGAVIYYRNEQDGSLEYLILHYGTSHWDFPKGKLEAGESDAEAALREIEEETGLQVSFDPEFEHKLYYKFRGRDGELVNKQVTFFTAQALSQVVTLSIEHTDSKWVSYEDARQLLTYDNAVNLLDMAHAYITRLHGV